MLKKIFAKRKNKTALIIGIFIVALLSFGAIAYASIPSFHNLVNSSIGKEEKNANISSNDNKTIPEENNTSDTSNNTATTEDKSTNTDVNTEKTPTTTTPKTNTPAPTSTSTPTSTSAPTPTPTPVPVTFQVSSVNVSVSPTTLASTNHDSYTFVFTGTITATAAGTVNYYWQRTGNDAGAQVPGTLIFSSAGSKSVNYSWSTNWPADSGSHTAKLVANSMSSQASFYRAR